MCECLCVRVCVCVYKCECMHTFMYVCVWARFCECVCVCVCMHAWVCVCERECAFASLKLSALFTATDAVPGRPA